MLTFSGQRGLTSTATFGWRIVTKKLHFGVAALICIGLVLLTLTGGSWYLLERSRQTALRAAETTLQHAALIVESVINRQLLQIDGALVSLPALFTTLAKGGDAVDAAAASRLLRGMNFQAFAFRDIILVNADGKIWASARPNPWSGNFPSAQLDPASTALRGTASVVGPFRNPVTGDWALLVVRHVTVPGAGVLTAAAEVPLPMISTLFAAVGEVPGLHIRLERATGELLLSRPYDEMQIGKRQPGRVKQSQSNGLPFIMPSESGSGPTIGIERVSLYPDVTIALTLDQQTAMSDWVRDRNRMVGFIGSILILLSALAVTLNASRRQRERADQERSKARTMLESAIESMPDGFVMWDKDDRLVTCNQQFRTMYRASQDFIHPGASFEDIIRGGALAGQYPDMEGDVGDFVQRTVSWHQENDGPMERKLPDGRWILVAEHKTPDGGRVGIRTDITDLKLALSALAAANDRTQEAMRAEQLQNATLRERDRALHIQNVLFDAALNNMSQGLLMVDKNQRLIVHNHRFLELFAIDYPDFAGGLSVEDIFAAIEASGRLNRETVAKTFLRQRDLAAARQPGSFLITGENGLAVAISQRTIADGGWIATYEDVSDQQRAEEHIRFAAHHDAMTELPNRVLFRIRLDEMIGSLENREEGLAVLFLDLDRFKQVNDTLGHPIGDALLVAASRRLVGCLRPNDVAARLGGDEFAIAYLTMDLPAAAERLCERIITALSAPYVLEGHTVIVGVSVGIALADGVEIKADTLLKNADMALYRSKARGRGVCTLFEADMERQLLTRLAIETDLGNALKGDQFELLYQPLYDLKANNIAGFEALIRWNHPDWGVVSPGQFIQVAEETGQIRLIGEWVIHTACRDAMKLPDHIKMAVNLSPAQFDSGDIVEVVNRALLSSGLPASRLELEITETALLQHNERTLAQLYRLHEIGLRIALDDFGTGYSSLSYLRSFPFDKLKIDQSFVREMSTRSDCAAIVSSVVGLANELNITTTAEGIETLEQLEMIRRTGCTEAQGYLFSVPRCLSEVLDYFAESSGSSVERAAWIMTPTGDASVALTGPASGAKARHRFGTRAEMDG